MVRTISKELQPWRERESVRGWGRGSQRQWVSPLKPPEGRGLSLESVDRTLDTRLGANRLRLT